MCSAQWNFWWSASETAGPATCEWLANQIGKFRILACWDTSEKNYRIHSAECITCPWHHFHKLIIPWLNITGKQQTLYHTFSIRTRCGVIRFRKWIKLSASKSPIELINTRNSLIATQSMSFLKVTGSRSGIGLFCNSNNCKNYLSNELLSFVPLDVIPCYFSVSLCDNFISCASKIIHKAKMAHSAQNETAKYNFSLGQS